MAANMYRVGGMYVNVDLFYQTETFTVLHPLGIVWLYCCRFASNSEIRLWFTHRVALSWSRKVIISKYLGFKMGQASRLSWPQQLAASLLNS